MKKSQGFIILFSFFIFIINISPGYSLDQDLDQSYVSRAQFYYMKGEIDSADYYFRKALSTKGLEKSTKGMILTQLCNVYRKKGNYNQAIEYGNTALNHYQTAHDSTGMMEANLALAKVYNAVGDKETALNYYFQLLPYYEGTHDMLKISQIYGSIANVYMDIEQVAKGVEYYKLAIEVLEISGVENESTYADLLNNLGIAYYNKREYDSALYYYKRSMYAYQTAGWQDAIAASMQNIGITLVKTGQSKKGLHELHRAYQVFDHLNLERDRLSVLIDLGTAFTDIGMRDSASYFLHQALRLADSLKHTYYKKMTLWNLYQLYQSQNMPEKALNAFQNYVFFKDSIDNLEMKKSLIEMESKYKASEREKEIQELKYEKKIADANLQLLLIGITTFMIIVILIIRMLILKRRKDRQIHQQKMLVYEKEKKLAASELAEHRMLEKKMEDELEFKTRQLASHAMHMMQKNKMLQEISETITLQAKASDDRGKEGLNRIKHQLEKGINADKDWELFKLYFEQINKEFFQQLKQINPRLTTNDFRMAALIRMNMSIKEMASVLNISPNSLKNARYRLKKKLKLGDEQKLGAMIRNL